MKGNLKMETVKESAAMLRKFFHPNCVVCGSGNICGLNLEFEIERDLSVRADFVFSEEYEGYRGVIHGGIISTILDGAMCNCMFANGKVAVTAEMTVRYRQAVVIGERAEVRARMTRRCGPLYFVEAQVTQNGQIKTTAKSKYYDKEKREGKFI